MSYTPPKYPGEIPTYADIWPYVDDKDWMNQACWDALIKELRACLIELGVNPKGAYADVAARLTALSQAAIPSGLIAMWHGLIANIPAGWVICDGNNGTPNLLDKFVKGVPTAATNPGSTGGVTNHKHTQPTHTHPNNFSIPNHSLEPAEMYFSNPLECAFSPGSHPISGGVQSGGGDDTGETDARPPYYEVAFIMKT